MREVSFGIALLILNWWNEGNSGKRMRGRDRKIEGWLPGTRGRAEGSPCLVDAQVVFLF